MANRLEGMKNPIFEQETTAEKQKLKRGRKPLEDRVRNLEGGNSSQEGLPPEYTRFSVICKVSNVNDIKNYAYTKRISIKEATDEIIEAFFTAYRKNKKNEPLLENPKKDNRL